MNPIINGQDLVTLRELLEQRMDELDERLKLRAFENERRLTELNHRVSILAIVMALLFTAAVIVTLVHR